MSLRRFCASYLYDNNLPSLVCVSLLLRGFSRVFLLFPQRGHKLPPLSVVTISTHTPASNTIAFQPPAMSNARTSLCTESIHFFSFPPGRLCTAPSRFPNTIHFGNPPPLIRMSPRLQTYCRVHGCLNALISSCVESMVVAGGHPVVWTLELCPDDEKQDPVV